MGSIILLKSLTSHIMYWLKKQIKMMRLQQKKLNYRLK